MQKLRIKALLALGVVAMFALLAGCGGSSDSTTDSSSSFVSDADGICKDINSQGKAIAQPTSASEVEPYLNKIIPITADGVSQLEALTPPSDQQTDFDAWIATLKDQQSQLEDAQKTAATDPNAAVTALQGSYQKTNTKGNQQAAALGLTECASAGGGGSSGGSSS